MDAPIQRKTDTPPKTPSGSPSHHKPVNLNTMIIFILGVLIVMAIFLFVMWILFNSWADRGNFGNMFGALNACFTGLAFAGVIYTLIIQRRSLSLQIEGLIKTSEMQISQYQIIQKQHNMDAVRNAFIELDSKEIHEARNYIYNNAKKFMALEGNEKMISELNAEDLKNAAQVSSSFDRVGFFVAQDIISKKLILENFAPSIARSWYILKPYIEVLRKTKYHSKHEGYFEQLALDSTKEGLVSAEEVKSMISHWIDENSYSNGSK